MPLTLVKSGNPLEAIGGDRGDHRRGRARAARSPTRRDTARVINDLRERIAATRLGVAGSASRLVLLLGLSAIAQETGASTLVAGFLAGMVLVRLHELDRLTVQFMGVANGFFVPLFFVLLGAELNLRALLTSPSRILLAVGLAVAAVITHLIAARDRRPRAVSGDRPRGVGAVGNARGSGEPRPERRAAHPRRGRSTRRRRRPDADPGDDRVADARRGGPRRAGEPVPSAGTRRATAT